MANFYLLLFIVANFGSAYLLLSGLTYDIVWQQLVGGTCFISSLVSYGGPGLPWEERKATTTTLRLLTVWLRIGVLVAGSTFINVLFAFLAFRVGDSGSYYWWCVALVLLCLQFFAGRKIMHVGTRSWWVWSVAMAVYSFGQSAQCVGVFGLCGFVTSKLPTGGFAEAFVFISGFICVPMLFTMLASSDLQSRMTREDKQVLWQDHIHVYQGYGRFQYIICPDSCGVVPTTELPEVNPYAISDESVQRSSERNRGWLQ